MRGCCFIVPPYILRALSAHGDAHVRDAAHESLVLTERLRGRRPLEAILASTPLLRSAEGEQRRVFTCDHTTHVPGMIVRSEGQPPVADAVADRAYDAAGITYAFYEKVLGRESIDARGMHLLSSVHYARHFDNAFWNGLQMVYGDGDGTVFGDFTQCLDVIGHELTHGVVQYEADLDYEGQPGALNESIADVFGTLVKQWHAKQKVDEADWLIGAGLLKPEINAEALRSLAAPGTAYDDPALGGKDRQPAHMRDFAKTADDDGGVHINSGIPNHAFYLAARAFGGHAWQHAGRIWYDTMTREPISANCTFAEFAARTVDTAAQHTHTEAEEIVRHAWRSVGVPELAARKSHTK